MWTARLPLLMILCSSDVQEHSHLKRERHEGAHRPPGGFCFLKSLKASRVHRTAAVTFTLMTDMKLDIVISSMASLAPPIPAF